MALGLARGMCYGEDLPDDAAPNGRVAERFTMTPQAGRPPERRPPEYDGDRDTTRFWAEIRPRREPMQQRWFLPLILLLLGISIPWYRKPGEIGTMVAGLPVWVWVALGASAMIALITAVVSLRFWDDDEDDGA